VHPFPWRCNFDFYLLLFGHFSPDATIVPRADGEDDRSTCRNCIVVNAQTDEETAFGITFEDRLRIFSRVDWDGCRPEQDVTGVVRAVECVERL